MHRSSRILVAGYTGLVGSALVRCLKRNQFKNLLLCPHSELNLTDQIATRQYFQSQKPDVVILAAAKVGGINANNSYPAEFIQSNLAIQTNVIHEAYRSGVKDLLFMGSSCVYPRDCPQPIREEFLLTGLLEPTNRPYALAKIAGIEMCWAYNRQYGTRYFSLMPTNLYGPGDNYDLEGSHVLPALIRKTHEAKKQLQESIGVWGTGTVKREFLHSDDLAEACLLVLSLKRKQLEETFPLAQPPLINIGSGSEVTIRELLDLVVQVIGYKGDINWDTTKPSGTERKLLDSSRINSLGWHPRINLIEGIRLAYDEFVQRI